MRMFRNFQISYISRNQFVDTSKKNYKTVKPIVLIAMKFQEKYHNFLSLNEHESSTIYPISLRMYIAV